MIALAPDLPPVTMADVLAREAGPPHVWTHADAMALALETGWHIEPPVEVAAELCAAQVPVWHAGADWSLCARVLAEDPKGPTLPAETWALLGAPGGIGLPVAWGYPPAVSRGAVGGAAPAWRGGWWGGGGDGAETVGETRETLRETVREVVTVPERTTCCGHCVICPLPPDEPPDVPAPVPLPGSGWLLAGLLGLLFTRRN